VRETLTPSRTLVLVPAALEKPGWKRRRAILLGTFLPFIISPRSDGLACAAGGWETVREQSHLENDAGGTLPSAATGQDFTGGGSTCPTAGSSIRVEMPTFWGDPKQLSPPKEVTLALLAATGTSAHVPLA